MLQAYEVKLDAFEGPLDLLLHLVNQFEVDIYDIPVAEITSQYLSYIHTMQTLELNIASEYLVMAATLLEIKSKLLLPNQTIDDDEMENYEEDPRDELMRRLIEYRKYKEAASHLKEKELEATQIYTRPPMQLTSEKKSPPMEKGEVNLYDMLQAMGKIMERKKWNQPMETTIKRTEIQIKDRMQEIRAYLYEQTNGIMFTQLFPYPTKSHIVVTFMAILELMKLDQIYCRQKQHFEEIMLYPKLDVV
ncbi:segregation/condensation protein A [Saliterribacillus persicus]|uniref:Segregation and condensation protein A n=1 Tax=Saliterribacillus persicus TaxID=930114 RepID=A0A368XCB1_9BACI|nr:segregation/condensation protein A [Saliterribacillus persicus]RCW64866.1 condensin subunit ScpA [Saliterribacillus persicus]